MKIRTWLIAVMLLCLLTTGAAASSVLDNSYETLCLRNGLNSPYMAAWLEIPGTDILRPVMQHPEDDSFYAKHNPNGTESESGSLYTQHAYNAFDFSDPVTLIYGSSVDAVAPLGQLQELYSAGFDQYRTIYLHLPQHTLEYRVFAAIPFSSLHILHYYDFSVPRRFNSFFNNVFSTRALAMHLDEDNRPEPGKDRVLILSTSIRGDKSQRYLVMATLVPQEN